MDWITWELIALLAAVGWAGHMDLKARRLEQAQGTMTGRIEWLQGECKSLSARLRPFEERESERELNAALARLTRDASSVRQPSNGS